MSDNVTIRPVVDGDETMLAPLMKQLGYDTDAPTLRERLSRYTHRHDQTALMAILADQVVGCISLHWFDAFHTDVRLGRISALVVDAPCRGKQIGAALVAAGEAWLLAQGCQQVELTSNAGRRDAHRFYERHGYCNDSLRYVKSLASHATGVRHGT